MLSITKRRYGTPRLLEERATTSTCADPSQTVNVSWRHDQGIARGQAYERVGRVQVELIPSRRLVLRYLEFARARGLGRFPPL